MSSPAFAGHKHGGGGGGGESQAGGLPALEDRVEADEAICARMPEPFMAVGMWYDDFSQTTDDEVRELLANSPEPANESEGLQPPRAPTGSIHEPLHVEPFVGPGATS